MPQVQERLRERRQRTAASVTHTYIGLVRLLLTQDGLYIQGGTTWQNRGQCRFTKADSGKGAD